MEHDGTGGCLGKWIYSTIKAFNHTSNASWTGGTEVFAVVCGDVAVVGLPFLGNKRMELFGTSQWCFLLETTWFHAYKGIVQF